MLHGACGLDGLSDAGGPVRRQVIHDHDISGIEGRRQRLLDIGKKSDAIHGAVEHHRCGHSGQPKRAGKGGCLPMPVGDARATALAPPGTPTQPRHLRRQARLVDEDQPGRIEVELAVKPSLALSRDFRPLLLQCVCGFFVREATPARPVVQRAPANPDDDVEKVSHICVGLVAPNPSGFQSPDGEANRGGQSHHGRG